MTLSPSSGCAGGLVAPKLTTGVQLCVVYIYITVRPVAGRNATLLVSGMSEKPVAVGLLVVDSISWIVFKRTFPQFVVL